MTLNIDEFLEKECTETAYELEDYEGDIPRWCKGCGDLGVLTAVQKILRDRQIKPESVVCVSGIGCSSRFPHYLKTYGFHGIHGRALPISTGVALSRPDLFVMTIMGDGDCFSIGGGHWMHAMRYNPNLLVLVLDNEVYGLTKKQASPTTPIGVKTNTTPRGAYLEALNPLSVALGVTNVSFVAQTATFLAAHLEATIKKAWDHNGLSFVRILQRCPAFMPTFFTPGSNIPVVFLENENGIPVHKGFLKNAPTVVHPQENLHEAMGVALNTEKIPLGLLYHNPSVPTYQDVRRSKTAELDRTGLVGALNSELDKYAIN